MIKVKVFLKAKMKKIMLQNKFQKQKKFKYNKLFQEISHKNKVHFPAANMKNQYIFII